MSNIIRKTINKTTNKIFGGLGEYLLAGFLVWCTFNYDMSDTSEMWFYIWAVLLSL